MRTVLALLQLTGLNCGNGIPEKEEVSRQNHQAPSEITPPKQLGIATPPKELPKGVEGETDEPSLTEPSLTEPSETEQETEPTAPEPSATEPSAPEDVFVPAPVPSPAAPTLHFEADLPSPFPAGMHITQDGEQTYLTVTGDLPTQLFRAEVGNEPAARIGNFSSFGPQLPGRFTSHLTEIDRRTLVIYNTPDGFTLLNRDGTISDQVALADLDLDAALGHPVNFPKGGALLGNRFCLSTSNLKLDTMTYHAGNVLCFDYADGVVDANSARALTTTAQDPTALRVLGDKMAVLNSADFDPETNDPATIDIFDPTTMEIERSISLGARTAQLEANFLVDGATAYIGTQIPRNEMQRVDLATGEHDVIPLAVNNFTSYATRFGPYLVFVDQGFFDRNNGSLENPGRLLFLHSDRSEADPLITEVTGTAGALTLWEDRLLIAVTDRVGTDHVSTLWSADLGGLE